MEHVPEIAAEHRVQTDGRLIEDEQLGFAKQRRGERDTGSLAARHRPHDAVRAVAKIDDREHFVDPPGADAENPAEVREILARGQIAVHGRRLRHISNARPEIRCARRTPEHLDPTGSNDLNTDDRADQGRLSRATRPEQARHPPRRHGDGDVAKDGVAAADDLESLHADGRVAHHRDDRSVRVDVREVRGGTLIVGGGYAGSVLARLLGEATIVTPENYMLFRPLLAEAASATLEPRHVVVPLRMMCPQAELIVGRATTLDEGTRTLAVATHGGEVFIRYERLVLALGAVTRTLPIPGLAEHAFGFNDLADAIELRNHVLHELEASDAEVDPARRQPHLAFVFVGAGYAGIEAAAELNDLVRDALRHYPRLRAAPQRWVVVEATARILPEINRRLAEYVARRLVQRGIELRTETRLESLDADSATLSGGERIETHTVVWTAGVRPNPLLAEWGLPLDERGRVQVGDGLRVADRENVWALGDCARVPNRATDAPDPATSQHALRQARQLARNLRGDARPYRYRSIGEGATLGRFDGIAEIFGIRLHGFAGWFATRTYHLYQLPLLTRKLRVVADWTVSMFFRRDISVLGSIGHPRRLES